jgi:hypothetical protein
MAAVTAKRTRIPGREEEFHRAERHGREANARTSSAPLTMYLTPALIWVAFQITRKPSRQREERARTDFPRDGKSAKKTGQMDWSNFAADLDATDTELMGTARLIHGFEYHQSQCSVHIEHCVDNLLCNPLDLFLRLTHILFSFALFAFFAVDNDFTPGQFFNSGPGHLCDKSRIA